MKADRKRKTSNTGGSGRKPRSPMKWNMPKMKALGGVLAILVLIVLYALLFRKNGTEVFLNSESVGILEGRSTTAEVLVETLETQLAGIVGSDVKINETIETVGVHISGSRKKDVCTMEYLLPKMRNMVTYKVDAALIMVDGGKVAALATEEQANAVLDKIKEPYLPSEEATDVTTSWVENVTITHEFLDSDEILTEELAITSLQKTTTVTKSHTIQSGESLYLLASKYETTAEEILNLNDGMTMQTSLRVGELINVPEEKPLLSVKTVEIQVLTTVEPKTYEYRYDDTQPSSYQKVVQQGRAGQKESKIQITRINGFVDEEKEISKNVIVEPVPEIIVRGTK